MDAVPLKECPLAGEYEEHQFGASNDVTWVKFTDDEYAEWCGLFANGSLSQVRLLRFGDKPFYLVLARGKAFVVDVNARRAVQIGNWNNFSDVIYCDRTCQMVLTQGTIIIVADETSHVWQSERLCNDGIAFIECEGPTVRAWLDVVFEENASQFTVNLDTRDISGEWLYFRDVKDNGVIVPRIRAYVHRFLGSVHRFMEKF